MPFLQEQNREKPKDKDWKVSEAIVIKDTRTERASPVVFVLKRDGSLRFRVDYRKSNSFSGRDCYHLSRIVEYIKSLGGAQVFSTLATNSGYWHFKVDKADRETTALTSHHRVYQFIAMLLCLKKVASKFERVTDVIVSTLKWKYVLVYLEDIVDFSKELGDHIEHTTAVLRLLEDSGVTLKWGKCAIFTNWIY